MLAPVAHGIATHACEQAIMHAATALEGTQGETLLCLRWECTGIRTA